MRKIDIKGRIIGNASKWIYDWLDIPSTCPKDVTKGLQDANGEEVEVQINSGGGSVYDGYEIYNALAEYKGQLTIKIVGLAASAASFISQVPNAKCYMSPLAEMMIHNSSTWAAGPHQILDSTSQSLQVTDATIAKAYTMKSGRAEQEIRDLMEKETWLTSEQAKELGLIDGIMFETRTESNIMPKLYNALSLDDDALLNDLEKCKSVDELKNRLTENLDKMFANAKSGNQSAVINSAVDNKKSQKEDIKMTLDQLKTDHADLYNEIVKEVTNSVTKSERERIAAINELAQPGLEDIVKNGIENGLAVGEVAVNILNFQKQRGAQHLQNMRQDADDSGVNDAAPQAEPQKVETKADQKQNAVNLLVDAANFIIGGRE